VWWRCVSDEFDTRMLRELSDARRSLEAFSGALLAASLDARDDVEMVPAAVTKALLANRMTIDAVAIEAVFLGIVAYMAELTGETPRTIYEAYFKGAPDDAWWRARVQQREERRDAD
jgi:hypothetical protein